MKKIILIGFLGFAASVVMLFEMGRTSAELAADGAASAAPSASPAARAMRRKIAAMPLDEKIGQMLMVAIPDAVLSAHTAEWLRGRHIGGVILLGHNIRTEGQTARLIRDLQEKARGPGNPPLFISADQEGGAVSRFLFLKELTAQKDIVTQDQALDMAEARAEELRALGINVNFSPVLDVAESPKDFIAPRAFSGSSEKVAELATAMIRGYENGGVIAAAKHFPGHGGTPADSHKDLPTVSRNADAAASALLPFREAIKEHVPMVMVGHIKVPEIDHEYPASLSPATINILRSSFGFNGIIITDNLGMGAITRSYSLPDAAVQSIKAGADIALAVRAIADYNKVQDALMSAVRSGDISEISINQSVSRIISLKDRYLK